jgi:histidyl-tRNA synthetase
VAESFGYEPVSVSLVERAEAYSEEIVGMSPWPEWNRRSCFFFDIEDYGRRYAETPGITKAVLVPEGTLSITRWLGAQLGTPDAEALLPLRIYYEQSCFRNELIGSLTDTKGRQFTQFGVEILGGQGVVADVEPLVLAHEMIQRIVGDELTIVFRLSLDSSEGLAAA